MKHFTPVLLVFCLLCSSCNQKKSESSTTKDAAISITSTEKTQYKDITIDELAAAFGTDDYVLIDVRTPEEIASGMIDGAQHVDFVNTDFKEQINQLDRNENYVIYCRSGGRSTKACQLMQKLGFKNVANLEGGYLAYTDSQ